MDDDEEGEGAVFLVGDFEKWMADVEALAAEQARLKAEAEALAKKEKGE